jgi:hypothetical protein
MFEEIPRGGPSYIDLKNDPKRNFILAEGKIKHFVIRLQRAAGLEITAKIKLPSGTSVNKDRVQVLLDQQGGEKNSLAIVFKDGFFKSRCLPPLGETILEYNTYRYTGSQVSINLRAGQVEKLELIFDFVDGTIVHGFIKSKQANPRLAGIVISLFPKGGGTLLETTTDNKGEFWFAGMKPGEYFLVIVPHYGPLIKEVLTINKNDKIEFTKEF